LNIVESTTAFTSALDSLMHELGLIEIDTKLEKAVNDYVSDLANIFGENKDNLTKLISRLLSRLKKKEFWSHTKDLQRKEVELTTTYDLEDVGIIVESVDSFSNALNSLMDELHLIKRVDDADSRMVAVDFHITDTNLQYKFDLKQFEKKVESVALEWNRTTDKNVIVEEKYIAPYFCFI
jgi:hypothetical protein